MAARIINAASGVYPGLFIVEFDIGRAGGEVDTGFDFKEGDVIQDAWVDVDTLEATSGTKTIDIGLLSSESGGDADGIMDGLSTAAAGVIKGTLISTGQTRGALLRADESGAGVLVPESHAVTTAKSLTYTLGAAHTELVAKGYILFWRSPSRL